MRKSDGKVCPHCGDDGGYIVGVRVNGWAQYFGGWDGGSEEMGSDDGLRYSRPKTVCCEKCKRRVTYPTRPE